MKIKIPKSDFDSNLTLRIVGGMPLAIQKYLNVSSWQDLNTNALITAVDGVTKDGQSWISYFTSTSVTALSTLGWKTLSSNTVKINDLEFNNHAITFDNVVEKIEDKNGTFNKSKHYNIVSGVTSMPSGFGYSLIIDEATNNLAYSNSIPTTFGTCTVIRRNFLTEEQVPYSGTLLLNPGSVQVTSDDFNLAILITGKEKFLEG